MEKSFDSSPSNAYQPRMKANEPGKLNLGRTIVLSLSFFTVLLAWSYFNFQVPLILDKKLPNVPPKDLYKGIIMALDNLLAVILQPFFGNLSDRTKSKFGRRIPFILIGTVFSAIFFFLIPAAQHILVLVLVIFFFDLFMSTFRSVSVAIVPDYTAPDKTSAASSIQQFVSNIGGVIAFFLPTLISMLDLSDTLAESFGFIVISVIMLLALLLLLVIIRETPTGDKWFQVGQKELKMDPLSFEIVNSQRNQPDEQEDAHIPIFTQIGDIFRHNRDMAIMLFVIFFLYLGFASIESFFSSFATSYVGFTQSQAGNLGLAYSGPMILSAPLHGIIGQKIGKKRALKISMVCQIVGVAIISAILIPLSYKQGSNPTIFILFLVNFAVISISWMGVIIQSFPVIWGLSPEGKIGSYMGVYYFFNQIAYMISPVLIGGVLSLFAGLGDERYIVMFPFVLFCLVVGFILVLFIKTPERELDQVKEKELKEKYMQDMD